MTKYERSLIDVALEAMLSSSDFPCCYAKLKEFIEKVENGDYIIVDRKKLIENLRIEHNPYEESIQNYVSLKATLSLYTTSASDKDIYWKHEAEIIEHLKNGFAENLKRVLAPEDGK